MTRPGVRQFHDNLGTEDDGVIHLYDFHCTGQEESIEKCDHKVHGETEICNAWEKAGVE